MWEQCGMVNSSSDGDESNPAIWQQYKLILILSGSSCFCWRKARTLAPKRLALFAPFPFSSFSTGDFSWNGQSCFLSHAKICTMWKLQEVQVWMHACVNQREHGWGDDWWNRWQLLQPASDSPQHKAPNGRATAEGESLVSFLSQPASLVTSMSASRFRHARFSRLC